MTPSSPSPRPHAPPALYCREVQRTDIGYARELCASVLVCRRRRGDHSCWQNGRVRNTFSTYGIVGSSSAPPPQSPRVMNETPAWHVEARHAESATNRRCIPVKRNIFRRELPSTVLRGSPNFGLERGPTRLRLGLRGKVRSGGWVTGRPRLGRGLFRPSRRGAGVLGSSCCLLHWAAARP